MGTFLSLSLDGQLCNIELSLTKSLLFITNSFPLPLNCKYSKKVSILGRGITHVLYHLV